MTTRCELYCGDCLEVMPTLARGSVAMCFADLPYGVTSATWDICLDMPMFWRAVHRCATAEKVTCLTATQPFASMMVASNIKDFRYDLIWKKVSAGGRFSAKYQPMRNHEHLLIFGKSKSVYNPQMTAGRKYAHSGSKYESQWYNSRMSTPEIRGKGALRYPKSVHEFCEQDLRTDTLHGHQPKRIHPTQKPIAMLEWLIKTYTNPGDTVLDPVFGSNTTGVACKRLGRHYIGIEKDKAFFEAGKARLEAEPWPSES